MKGIPNELHSNYYRRKRHLDAEEIAFDLAQVDELIQLLSPLLSESEPV